MLQKVGVAIFIVACFALHSADNEKAYEKAVACLRDAQNDHSKLIPAIKLLGELAESCEHDGNQEMAANVNSCLYWARKKMTLKDIEMLQHPNALSRLDAAAKPIPIDGAKAMFEKATEFVATHDDPLMAAIRYFEIADRFKNHDVGRTAMDLSLKFMQKVGEAKPLTAYKPTATDGKVFVQSDPPGASIILIAENDVRMDTGSKTPSLVQLPKGQQALSLEMPGMKPSPVGVTVGDSIAKTTVFKLEPITTSINVIFEDGWSVFLDGKRALDETGAQPTTPCTVSSPLGTHSLAIAKDGFSDISQRIDVKENMTVEFKQKPSKGVSVLLKSAGKMSLRGVSWESKPFCEEISSVKDDMPDDLKAAAVADGILISGTVVRKKDSVSIDGTTCGWFGKVVIFPGSPKLQIITNPVAKAEGQHLVVVAIIDQPKVEWFEIKDVTVGQTATITFEPSNGKIKVLKNGVPIGSFAGKVSKLGIGVTARRIGDKASVKISLVP
jgi:hypothetical protein